MTKDTGDTVPPAALSRRLIRASGMASLATAERARDGWPYASLVQAACTAEAKPILLLSDLADHSKNIAADRRVSLLFDGTLGLANPLTGARISLQGQAERITDAEERENLGRRYLSRHTEAAAYTTFTDFNYYLVQPERLHLVAGFGRIHWIDAEVVLFDADPAAALMQHEADILTHMNEDHTDAVQLYARMIDPQAGREWRMTGIDPEGFDLRRNDQFLRLDFGKIVLDPTAARVELARLAKQARRQDPQAPTI